METVLLPPTYLGAAVEWLKDTVAMMVMLGSALNNERLIESLKKERKKLLPPPSHQAWAISSQLS